MRSPILLFLALLGMGAGAQNWALLNPAYKYNYSNDGSDTISNQVFVTHIDTLGPDSFRYELNRIAERCDTCWSYSTECSNGQGLIIDRPQFLGSSIRVSGSGSILECGIPLLVSAGAALGDTWTDENGTTAWVLSVGTTNVFGQADSVIRIGYSSGDTLWVSKDHGLMTFSGYSTRSDLIGRQGPINEGAQFPTIIDFFNYTPGDILQYEGSYSGTDGSCILQSSYIVRYDFLTRDEQPGQTSYSVQKRDIGHYWGYALLGGGICFDETWDNETTVTLVIDNDEWTAENFLGSPWMDALWPQAFGPPPADLEATNFVPSWTGCSWHAGLDDQGRYRLDPAHLSDTEWSWPAASRCEGDSAYWPVMGDEIFGSYLEGVGCVRRSFLVFEHSGEEALTGYRIGGEGSGEILSFGERFGQGSLLIHPNPASTVISIQGLPLRAPFEIIDPQGRSIIRGLTQDATLVVPVDQLANGCYLLIAKGCRPQRFIVRR